MKLPAILLLTINFSIHIAIAQLPVTFQTRYYTTENGLPSNGVKGLEWDESTGFLWVATEAGIVRFNGMDFKIFNNQNTPFIGSERIGFINRNNRGAIYTADLDNHIIGIRQNYVFFDRSIPHTDHYFNPYLPGMMVSDSFLNYKITHRQPVTEPFSMSFTSVASLSDSAMIGIRWGKVHFVSMSKENPREIEFDNVAIKECFRIGGKLFLVSDNNEIFLPDLTMRTLLPITIRGDDRVAEALKLKEASFFWKNGQSNLILVSHSIAWEVLYNGTELIAKEICSVVPANTSIRCVQYSEAKKLLFIGTSSKGLVIISENAVTPVKKESENRNEANAYYSQIKLQDGNILTSSGDVIGGEKRNGPLPVQG